MVVRIDARSRGRGKRRQTLALAVVAISVVAAVAAWALADGRVGDDRILVVDDEGAISLLDPESGESLLNVPGATATPDRSALLTTDSGGGQTVLQSRDPVTGEVTGSTRLDGELTVRTVSPQGGAVALMPGVQGPGLYEPKPRSRTLLTVSYLDDRSPRTFDLEGNIEPEMFSYDEDGLFVLEFQPPTNPTSYLVRRLDLDSGEVTDTESPQVELNPRMRGKARAQVLHPDGTYLYTLYTLPGDAPVYDPETADSGPRHAFIHVINLEEEWSFCIFLDQPIGTGDEAAVGMGISPDGRALFVADPSTSTMARVDTDELAVAQMTQVEQLREHVAKASVAVADDGTAYVSSGRTVFELDRNSLQASFAWSMTSPQPVTGLSVGAGGDELRIAGGGVITIMDRASRREEAVLAAPGRGTVTLLGPPQGSVTEFPLECAC